MKRNEAMAHVMTRLEVHERLELEQLHRALERMDAGSWDRCASGGEAISTPRAPGAAVFRALHGRR